MLLFIKKSLIVSVIILMLHIVAAFFANGKTDLLYLKFTSSKQKSLILGTSIPAISILTSQINNSKLRDIYEMPIYNLGLTIGHSKYGPEYLDLIKRKLNKDIKNGLFLLHVDPWSLSREKTNFLDDENYFFERGKLDVIFVNGFLGVNFGYLIKTYPKGWGNIIIDYFKPCPYLVHDDGWTEVIPENFSKSPSKAKEEEYEDYIEMFNKEIFSLTRFKYLEHTIEFLKNYGDVFLVRIPKPKKMRELSNKFLQDFNEKIKNLSVRQNIFFIDLYNDANVYTSYDGNHLDKNGAKKFTIELVSEILKIKLRDEL